MSIEAMVEQDSQDKVLEPSLFPKPWWGKLIFGLFMVTMPILAFWATDLFKPEWQTGRFAHYVILLLFPQASLLFFPLLAYSIASYCFLLIDPPRYSQMPVIRFGIYTGALLAFQYSVLSGLFFFYDSSSFWGSLFLIVLWVLPIFSQKIYPMLINKWGARVVHTALALLAGTIFLVSAVAMRSPLSPLLLVLAGLTVAAPFWCFLMLLAAGLWLWKQYKFQFTFPQVLGVTAWLASVAAAWRYDILKMYELYAALPPQPPPDCYIATAAARGHPQFVQAWTVQRPDGTSMQVNEQLQRLKCAELALMAVQPRLHKIVRRAYDHVGKALAARIKNPFLADLAYLALKPCDWLGWLLLRTIVPEIAPIARKMYTN